MKSAAAVTDSEVGKMAAYTEIPLASGGGCTTAVAVILVFQLLGPIMDTFLFLRRLLVLLDV